MALTATGIIEIASNVNDFDVRENAMRYFEKAFQANPRNPLCMIYLAEHYFTKQEFQLATELCETGLQIIKIKVKPEHSDLRTYRQEMEYVKSTFYFILGKVEHAQENYDQAFQRYGDSLKHNPRNYQALFCQAKVHFHMGNF